MDSRKPQYCSKLFYESTFSQLTVYFIVFMNQKLLVASDSHIKRSSNKNRLLDTQTHFLFDPVCRAQNIRIACNLLYAGLLHFKVVRCIYLTESRFCTAPISRKLALISNCKYITLRAADQTYSSSSAY
jgi:hypothetical protein